MKRDRMWKRITCNQPVGWLHNKIGTIGFFLMGFAIFLGIRGIFGVSNEYSEHAEMMIEGYYEEQENTAIFTDTGRVHLLGRNMELHLLRCPCRQCREAP